MSLSPPHGGRAVRRIEAYNNSWQVLSESLIKNSGEAFVALSLLLLAVRGVRAVKILNQAHVSDASSGIRMGTQAPEGAVRRVA